MIKVTVQYNDHLVDIHFPCSETTLHSALMEIHAADDNPPELFIMSIFDDWNRMAKENRAKYPPGTRILLLGMDDPHHPVPPGTRGTVDHVDDGGNIHMKWDNGRTLSLCSDADSFRTLTAAELAEEQAQQENPTEDEGQDEGEAPVMSM